MKMCKKCVVRKPLTAFYKHKLTADGRNTYCKACSIAAALKWQKVNVTKHRGYVRKCNAAHPSRLVKATKKWKAKNMPRVRSTSAEWQKANPAQANKRNAKHRAHKLRATPAWANQNYIADTYANAVRRTVREGAQYHVDHIVPLRSKYVCGLHWEENLQVIPSAENTRKGNRYWPDMPELRA